MPRSRFHTKLLGCAAAVLTPGCSCGPSPPSPPEVESVVVRPGTILAEPLSEFTLGAVPKGKFGVHLDLSAHPGLTIAWSDPSGVLADPKVNPARVTVPDDPGTSFRLVATVSSSGKSPVASNRVTVLISPKKGSTTALELDATEGTSDWVNAEHVARSPPAAFLAQARDGASPVRDWAVGVVGHVRLGRNLTRPAGATDLSESAIFARARHMHLRPAAASGQPWTAGADEILADPMESGGFRRLSVRVGVGDLTRTVKGVAVVDWVEGQVETAFGLLDRNRAGVELDLVDVFQHGLVDSSGDPLPAEPLGHCAVPQAIATEWEIDQDVLYVVYAPDILLWPTDTSTVPERRTGWACAPALSGDRNRLVFLSWAETFPATLAHELGHVLALTASNGGGAAGHVNGLGLPDSMANLMWSASGIPYGSTRSHLTLGQLYRMNADVDSWLNLVSPPGSKLARDCTTTAWGACPALPAGLGG